MTALSWRHQLLLFEGDFDKASFRTCFDIEQADQVPELLLIFCPAWL